MNMDPASSFLLLFIFAILIFGVPLLLVVIRLIETISERRESVKHAEDDSTSEERPAIRKRSKDDASEWTPAKHMR